MARGELPIDKVSSQTEIKEILIKWTSCFYTILVIMVATSCINLHAYLSPILSLNENQSWTLKYISLSCYFGGAIAGPIADICITQFSFSLCALFTITSGFGLSLILDSKDPGSSFILVMVLVCILCFCSAMAVIDSIATVMKNYQKNTRLVVLGIFITLYGISPLFEKSLRESYCAGLPPKSYILLLSMTQAIVYFLAIFLITETELKAQMNNLGVNFDSWVTFTTFTTLCLFTIPIIYFSEVISPPSPKTTCTLFLVYLGSNCLIFTLTVLFLVPRVRKGRKGGFRGRERAQSVLLRVSRSKVLKVSQFVSLMIGTFVVIGAGEVLTGKNGDEGMGEMYYWIFETAGRLFGGLICHIFLVKFNGFLYAAICTSIALIGIILSFFAALNTTISLISACTLAWSVGNWWVIVPQIICRHLGIEYFETLWGLTLSFNFIGAFTFTLFFNFLGKVIPKGKSSVETILQCAICACLCFLAIISLLFGYSNFVKTSSELQPLDGTKGDSAENGPFKMSSRVNSSRSDKPMFKGEKSGKDNYYQDVPTDQLPHHRNHVLKSILKR